MRRMGNETLRTESEMNIDVKTDGDIEWIPEPPSFLCTDERPQTSRELGDTLKMQMTHLNMLLSSDSKDVKDAFRTYSSTIYGSLMVLQGYLAVATEKSERLGRRSAEKDLKWLIQESLTLVQELTSNM